MSPDSQPFDLDLSQSEFRHLSMVSLELVPCGKRIQWATHGPLVWDFDGLVPGKTASPQNCLCFDRWWIPWQWNWPTGRRLRCCEGCRMAALFAFFSMWNPQRLVCKICHCEYHNSMSVYWCLEQPFFTDGIPIFALHGPISPRVDV